MNSLLRTPWFLTVAAVLCGVVAQAKPIDDAKAQLAQKNYDRVDKLLAQDLAVRSPDAEALRVSLAAALAAGKPVTAEARIEALLKQRQDADLLLSGAQIAEILSDERMALTRFLAYARAETRKSSDLEAALSYVLQRNAYPDEFRKYVDLFGAGDRAWSLADEQWRYLVGQHDGDHLLALAEFVMQKWPAPAQITTVHQWLYEACDSYAFGREPRARFWRAAELAAKYCPGDGQYLRKMIARAQSALTDQERAQFAIDVVKATGAPPPSEISAWFSSADAVKDEATRLQLGRAFLANEQAYRDSKNPEDYQQFIGTILQLPNLFNIKGQALVTRAALDQKIEALCGRLSAKRGRYLDTRGLQQGWPQEAADRIAFLKKHFPLLDGPAVAELLELTKNEDFDRVVADHLKGKSLRYTWRFRGSILSHYAALHRKAELLAAAKDYLAAFPFDFDLQNVRSNVLDNADLSVDEKANLLRECFTKAGRSVPMTDLIRRMTGGKPPVAPPQFLALAEQYGRITAGSDAGMRAQGAMTRVPTSGPNRGKQAHEVAARFLQEFKGLVPGDGPDAAKDLAELQAADLFGMHRDHVESDPQQVQLWAELWAPRVGPGAAWTDNRRGLLVLPVKSAKAMDALFSIAEAKYKGTPQYGELTELRARLLKSTITAAQPKGGDAVAADCEAAFQTQLDVENWGELMRLAPRYAAAVRAKHVAAKPDDWEHTLLRLESLVRKLEAKKAYESAFAVISGVERCGGEMPDDTRKQLALFKARAAMHIPGLIPVPVTSPTYDLYAAAHALRLGDEGQAWDLTRLKLKVLPSEWTSLDPAYVAWTVEQMRKQKLLKPALDLAMTVLLGEKELDPEIAARVTLAKGEIYADMENYQAARLEFESLRNSSIYGKTEAGTLALSRLINLLIVTKDFTGAEGLLARLVDSDRLQSQSEGYYLYAKMAFLQGDYKEAAINLRKVKERTANHVEAALLQGEVNLHLPGGLQYTEVEIGDPRLSTIVIPGQVLTLKLNDANLSIAHGEASVPVVIKTSKGGDEESIKLLPSSANKNLFVGTIPTVLGKAMKNDLTLQLRGDDQVTYEIADSFQKANGLNYPPKTLDVRFDARMMASSGAILSEEEQDKIEMERRIRQSEPVAQIEHAKHYQRRVSVPTVRPGGDIRVQVIDPAASTGDAQGTVKISLRSSSGDALEGFALRETGPYSGIFRGAVPTTIPRPKATASDTEEGRGVGGVINSTNPAPWVSLADGKKPKWLEIDTMSSYPVSSFRAELASAASIREATLQWQLIGDYLELAHFPSRNQTAKGGLQLQVVGDDHGGSADQLRELLKRVGGEPAILETASFDRQKDAPATSGEKWYSMRMTGVFYLPQHRVLTLKFLQNPGPKGPQNEYLFIDQQQVLGSATRNRRTADEKRVDLARGIHHLEVLAWDHSQRGTIVVTYESGPGKFEPLPKTWFSARENPELAAFLKPKASLRLDGDALVATLDQPQRLRKMRLLIQDYAGTAVSVKNVTIKDDGGQVVVPVKEDFSSSKKSQSLQVAPGDRVRVVYEDQAAIGAARTLTADLNAAFHNGSIILANEEISDLPGGRRSHAYFPARRCRQGDQLVVIVDDHDADVSDQRDTVDVTVTTSAGEKLLLKALETELDNGSQPAHNHAGTFMATLKIGDHTAKDQIKVAPGDEIMVSYLDKENTDPGVPVDRNYTVVDAGESPIEGLIYRTSVKQVEDTSTLAQSRKARIKSRQGSAPAILKELVVARHPNYQPPGGASPSAAVKKDDDVVVAVNAPLLFEVTCPKNALNPASVMYVTAVAESELKAAAREGKEPLSLKVPMHLEPIDRLAATKGIPVQLQTPVHRDAAQMLQEGIFAGIIRFEPGKRGEPVSDLISGGGDALDLAALRDNDRARSKYRVPTMRVSGADVVYLKYQDPQTKQTAQWKVRLLSDGRMELMDSTFTGQNDTIHLGAKFAIRVVDPDRDSSDDRDTVQVRAKATSGDELTLTLTETLPHSGVFETAFQPELIGEKGSDGKLPPLPAHKGDKLYVTFGDDVAFTYDDPQCVSPPGTMTVTRTGHIAKGADAQLAVFSKQFKDPEMAVKTQFLIAEALFEMAKEHRKFDQKKKADEEILRGKTILEEAIRDYPRTSLTAQGDYLLANLAQELGNLQEAISRYAHIISTYPESEYASASQFKKALCYEKMGNFDAACEEYVKLTYVYPDSSFVVDATLRLGSYYYKKESYQIAAKIFLNFKQKNPAHKMAPPALFLAAQCSLKQKSYAPAAKLFTALVDEYPEEKTLRAEAMYWAADSHFKAQDNQNAYRGFKRLTWDYPDSEWAKYARGRLSEETFAKMTNE